MTRRARRHTCRPTMPGPRGLVNLGFLTAPGRELDAIGEHRRNAAWSARCPGKEAEISARLPASARDYRPAHMRRGRRGPRAAPPCQRLPRPGGRNRLKLTPPTTARHTPRAAPPLCVLHPPVDPCDLVSRRPDAIRAGRELVAPHPRAFVISPDTRLGLRLRPRRMTGTAAGSRHMTDLRASLVPGSWVRSYGSPPHFDRIIPLMPMAGLPYSLPFQHASAQYPARDGRPPRPGSKRSPLARGLPDLATARPLDAAVEPSPRCCSRPPHRLGDRQATGRDVPTAADRDSLTNPRLLIACPCGLTLRPGRCPFLTTQPSGG